MFRTIMEWKSTKIIFRLVLHGTILLIYIYEEKIQFFLKASK